MLSMLLQELRVSLKFEDVLTGRKQQLGGFSVIENPGELVLMMVMSLVH